MLNAEQLKAREGKLTASRIAVLMKGDVEGIMQLYKEMIGEGEPVDLHHVWPVRLGEVTEALQCDWFEEKNGSPVTRRGEVVIHEGYDWAAATLDGWFEALKAPLEVKHVGGREPLEVIIERYQPQMQWQMEVTGASECILSVIMGASEPIVEFIPRDADYAAEMVKRGKQFMDCVAKRIPPVALPEVPAPIDATKIYPMSDNPKWKQAAEQWLQCAGAAQTAKDMEKILKSLIPEDGKKAFGCGVRITRDRAGRLSLREDK